MALKWLRDKMKYLTWILWIVILVFVAFLFLDFGGVRSMSGRAEDVAVTVGPERISFQEFRDAYRRLDEQYRQAFGNQLSDEFVARQVLDQLVNQRILLLEARRLGLSTTDAEVRKAILELPYFKNEEGTFIGDEEYLRRLHAARLAPDTFESSLRSDLLIDKLRDVIAETIYVSDAEVERAYREQAEKAKIRFVSLDVNQAPAQAEAPANETPPTEAELAAYFEEHQEVYRLPEKRVISYLLVDTGELRRQIEIPDAELRAYYDEHPDEFKRPERLRARHILVKVTPDRPAAQAEARIRQIKARIEGGEDFAAVAREASEDEGSAAQGGDLGYFGRGQMVPAFETAAFGAEVGKLVGPVQSDFGFHLIEVLDRQAGGQIPFEEAQVRIRGRLLTERVRELAEAKAREVAQRITAEKLSTDEQLRSLAEEEGVSYQTTEPFARADAIPGLGRPPELLRVAFELEQGAFSEPLELPRGWAVVRVQEIQPPRLPELAEVEERVRGDLEQKRRRAAALARLEEARQAIDGGESFDQVVAGLGLEIKESNEFGTGDSVTGVGRNQELVRAALAGSVGEVGGPIETATGAVLFEVTDRKTFDPAEFEKAKEETRQALVDQRRDSVLASLIEARRRDLAPQVDRRLQESFKLQGTAVG